MTTPSTLGRSLILWVVFGAAGLIAGGAVFHLYRTTAHELEQQAQRAVREEGANYAAAVDHHIRRGELAAMAELASFHLDGLTRRLQQWDQANELVLGTFTWSTARGFAGETDYSANSPSREELTAAWAEFRRWRLEHPQETVRAYLSGRYQCDAYRTDDAAAFSEWDLGYQAENAEIARHAKRSVEPWAIRMTEASAPDAPWTIWYQLGPGEDVRGCFLDARKILSGAPAAPEGNVIKARILPRQTESPSSTEAKRTAPVYGLPAYAVLVEPGAVFTEKTATVRLTALLAGGVLAVFVMTAITLARTTRRAAAEAERKITFVGQVSHELRTPLTSIQMLADLLRTPSLPEEKRLKFATTVAEETARLRALIEKLLTFNRLQQRKDKLDSFAVDVLTIVRSSVEQMTATLATAGIQTDITTAGALPAALADESLLKQALLNLLENAAKHAQGASRLQLRLAQQGASVAIDVIDDGRGIPPRVRDRIFEPFVQGRDDATNKTPGFGLGLSIARDTLRRLGGDVILMPSARGAHFRIELRSASLPVVIS